MKPPLKRIAVALACALIFICSTQTSQASAPAESDVAISLAIPLHNGERRVEYRDGCLHFAVVVTNTSKKPVRIWRDWCSWGYYGLEFEITDASGHKSTAKKKPAEFTRNFPDWWTLEAGETLVIDVDFSADHWEGFPKPENGSQTVTMRAIFKFEPDVESRKNHVWTGQASSKPERVTFYHWN